MMLDLEWSVSNIRYINESTRKQSIINAKQVSKEILS